MKYKNPEKAREAVIRVASRIDRVLWALEEVHHRIEDFERETSEDQWQAYWEEAGFDSPPEGHVNIKSVMAGPAMDDFGYAEALLHWEATGKNPRSIFSCSDPWMVLYRKELTEEFGLPVLTLKEAEERKAHDTETFYDKAVATGDPLVTPEYNEGSKKIEALREMDEQDAYMRKHFPRMFITRGGKA